MIFIDLQFHYFSEREFELGRHLLEISASSGLVHSIYALGMILFSEQGPQLESIQLLSKIEKYEIDKCRTRFKKILREGMWPRHSFRREGSTCRNSLCRNGGRRGLPTEEEWPRKEEDWFCCEGCIWGFEYYRLLTRTFNYQLQYEQTY